MTNRKQRSDSVSGLLSASKAARDSSDFEWPDDLISQMQDAAKQAQAQRLCDRFWKSRAPENWRPGDAIMLCELAKCSVTLDEVNCTLEAEGLTIIGEGSKGQPVHKRHPLADAQVQLSNRQLALMRALALTGTAQDTRSVANNARKVNEFRDYESKRDDDSRGLLA